MSYPFYNLDKGMAYISDKKNKPIKSINDLKEDDDININLKDGKLVAKIIKKIKRKA